jgi:hypothetical protein
VDLWSLAEGKHVCGWLPHEKDSDAKVRWVGFVDPGRVLTLNGAGRLVLWEVPACKAVWATNSCRDLPALSAGCKQLLLPTGASLELLDVLTGDRLGTLSGGAAGSLQVAAFRLDGKELAGVVRTGQGTSLVRWDLATGQSLGEFACPQMPNSNLHWCGTDGVMYGHVYLDLKLKWALCNYTLPGPGVHAGRSPDGRHWFVAGRTVDAAPTLSAQTLPDPSARQLAQQVAGGAVKPVVAPGMSLAVRVDGATSPKEGEAFRKRIVDGLTSRLTGMGFKVEPAAPLTLTVTIQPERATGEVRHFQTLGGGPKQKIDVNVMEVACQTTLTDAGGLLWEQKQAIRTPDPFGIVRTDDIQAKLSADLWNNVAGWASSALVPSYVLRTPAGVQTLPKTVGLSGDR